jgi:hypothetical protein
MANVGKRSTYRALVGKCEANRQLEDTDGKMILKRISKK